MRKRTVLLISALFAALFISGCDSTSVPDNTTEATTAEISAAAETTLPDEQPEILPLFEYRVNDGNITITKYNGTDTEVTVPSEIDGFPVTAVNCAAFNDIGVTSLSLSEGITRLVGTGDLGTSLEVLYLPPSFGKLLLTSMSYFYSLREINIVPNEYYRSSDGVMYSADGKTLVFMPSGRAGEFTVPDAVETIGSGSFRNSKLTSVIVPASVKRIEASAFADSALEHVTLSEGLESVGFYAFDNTKLTELSLPSTVQYCDKKIAGDLDIPISADIPVRGLTNLRDYGNVTYGNETVLSRALIDAEHYTNFGAGLIFMDLSGDNFPELIEVYQGGKLNLSFFNIENNNWDIIRTNRETELDTYFERDNSYMGWGGRLDDITLLKNNVTGETCYAVVSSYFDHESVNEVYIHVTEHPVYGLFDTDETGKVFLKIISAENSAYTPVDNGIMGYIEEHSLNGQFYVLDSRFADEPGAVPENAATLHINGNDVTEYPYIELNFPKEMQILVGGEDILHGAQYDGITYDYMSNTVTLENVDIDVSGKIGLELKNTGNTDIVLVGTNRIISDRLSFAAYDRITVTGDGELVTNNMYVDDESGIASSGSCLSIEGNARITEPESGGAIEVNYLVMKDNAFLKMRKCKLWEIDIAGYAVFRAEHASTFKDVAEINIHEHGEFHVQSEGYAFDRTYGAAYYGVSDDGVFEIESDRTGIEFCPYYCVLDISDRAQVTIHSKETCIYKASVIKFSGGRLELTSDDEGVAYLRKPLRDMGDNTGEIYIPEYAEVTAEPANWQIIEGYYTWDWRHDGFMNVLSGSDERALKHFVLYSE